MGGGARNFAKRIRADTGGGGGFDQKWRIRSFWMAPKVNMKIV